MIIRKGLLEINNVNINSNILDQLEFPLLLKFSNIGKLELKIPWSKLSSNPVHILLDKVFLIVSPKDKSQW